jgi:hypothetical protein
MIPRSLEYAITRFFQVGATFDLAKRQEFSDLTAKGLSQLMLYIHHNDVVKDFKGAAIAKPDFEAFSEHSFRDSEETFNPLFESLIQKVRPSVVIEAGTWFGTSAVIMASLMKRLRIEAKVICVDDFNGYPRAWRHAGFPRTWYGRSLMYEAFLSRIVRCGLEEYIIPLPTTSAHAYSYLSRIGVQADLIYIDANHDEGSVNNDLLGYFACMRAGGFMFGDDYTLHRYGYYPVKIAVDRFAEEWNLGLETHNEKWVIEAKMPFLATPE